MRVRLIALLALLTGLLWGAALPSLAQQTRPITPTPPVATPSAAARAQTATTFSVGVPGGDGYSPGSVVVDETRRLTYIYNSDSPQRRPVISVIDLAAGKLLRTVPLPGMDEPGGLGRLLLAPGGRLLLVDQLQRTLSEVDATRGTQRLLLSGVRDALLDSTGKNVIALAAPYLRSFPLADLPGGAPRWSIDGEFERIAVGKDRVAALAQDATGRRNLSAYDAATGAWIDAKEMDDPVSGLAAGPDNTWAVITVGEKPLLRRFDAGLEQTHETPIPYAYDVSLDAPRGRYLLSGFQSDGKISSSRILAYRAADLGQDAVADRAGSDVPAYFVTAGRNRILGYSHSGPSRLEVLDAGLKPVGRIIFGARPTGIALDEERDRLYVSDDHDRIRVFALPGGEVMGEWQGGAPLALDAKNGLLYANLPGKVVALDGAGAVRAEFAQEGWPAPDPNRDLVYIVANGVTVYDRSGKRLGTLPSTFPAPGGFIPNTYAQAALVNPVSGYLAVIVNNGVPGSNNGSMLRIYPPATDAAIAVPGAFSFVTDVAFDGQGDFYVTYSPAKSLDAVQVLSPQGKELRRLSGRSGQIALDAGEGALYLVTPGRVAKLDVGSLAPRAFFDGPAELERLAFSPGRQTLYTYGGLNSLVRAVPLSTLSPALMGARPAAPRPDSPGPEQLYVTADRSGDLLIVRYPDGLYRTRDGRRWEKLNVGTVASYGFLSVAPGGVLFWGGAGYDGGDGVWRSTDAGTTWQPLLGGLRDLRLAGNGVAAVSADEAYAINRHDGLLRWNPGGQVWERMEPGVSPAASPGELRAAPGGKELFHSAWDTLRKSTDGGRTWQVLKPPARSGNLIGFSGFYTVTRTLYGMWGDTTLQPMRSTDGGSTWLPLRTNSDIGRSYYAPEIASSGWDTYFLARPWSGTDSLLLRSTDNGDSWQKAPADVSRGLTHIAQGQDGRLWLGSAKAVRPIDPRTIRWVPYTGGAARPSPTAAPQPTPEATSTYPPCNRSLSASEGEIAARAPELGCPIGAAVETGTARESFQRGQMIWRSDNRAIYVVGPAWRAYADTWQEGEREADPTLAPPAGLLQPVRGFGKVWRNDLGGPAAEIGWATEKERGVTGVVQQWDRGVVFRFGGEVIILVDGGAVK